MSITALLWLRQLRVTIDLKEGSYSENEVVSRARDVAQSGAVRGGKPMGSGLHVQHIQQNRPQCLCFVSVYGTWESTRRRRKGSMFSDYPHTHVS